MATIEQEKFNYKRIEAAIAYIRKNIKLQPDLEEIAQNVNMSPFHLQRMFTEWVGVSPKKFMQFIALSKAKKMLAQSKMNIAQASFELGLSATSRLHDLFVGIEAMTPGEFKQGGRNLHINYHFAQSPFGRILIASTAIGVCYLTFVDREDDSTDDLFAKFSNANFTQATDVIQQQALQIFDLNWDNMHNVKLHLHGTPFQIKVWEALLKIPMGQLSTYGKVAQEIENSNASRAVGTAIGKNPVAFLIPCHRVIRGDGEFGEYMWGSNRKAAIIGWEACNLES